MSSRRMNFGFCVCFNVWYCIVLHCIVSYRIVSYRIVSYRIVSYGMVWYGMVWYGMVWYGLVECAVHVNRQVNSCQCGAKTKRACDRCKSRSTLWSTEQNLPCTCQCPTRNATARGAASPANQPCMCQCRPGKCREQLEKKPSQINQPCPGHCREQLERVF